MHRSASYKSNTFFAHRRGLQPWNPSAEARAPRRQAKNALHYVKDAEELAQSSASRHGRLSAGAWFDCADASHGGCRVANL